MTEPIDPTQRNLLAGLGGVQGPKKVGGENRPEETAPRGPAFQVLLEQLQAQARELEDTRQTVERPEDLARAVDRAQDSLEAALSFGDRLLEAYREQLHRTEDPGSTGELDRPGRDGAPS